MYHFGGARYPKCFGLTGHAPIIRMNIIFIDFTSLTYNDNNDEVNHHSD